MSDYTHLNLKNVEDQAPNFGLADNLEFRMARVGLGLENSRDQSIAQPRRFI